MGRDDEERGRIKITDRRSFTPSGERRTPEEIPPAQAMEPPRPVRGEGFELRRPPEAPPPQAADPDVNFTSFILSLASTAFIHLGEMEDPVTGARAVNPPAARQIIDIIEMLHARTKGNLDAKEDELLRNILAELKMTFAHKAARGSGA
jgi:hypothetical protein